MAASAAVIMKSVNECRATEWLERFWREEMSAVRFWKRGQLALAMRQRGEFSEESKLDESKIGK